MLRGQRGTEGPLPAHSHQLWGQDQGHCWSSAASWWPLKERQWLSLGFQVDPGLKVEVPNQGPLVFLSWKNL